MAGIHTFTPVRIVDSDGVAVEHVSTSFILPASANTTNATIVKASAGLGYLISGTNAAATRNYLKVYDKSTLPDENDTPKLVFALGATAVFNFPLPPFRFLNGIGIRLVTGAAHNNTTPVAANDIVALNFIYT